MSELISSKDLVVIQVEMDVYSLLRKVQLHILFIYFCIVVQRSSSSTNRFFS